MLVYEKWVTETVDKEEVLVRHLYGTEASIPSDDDNELVYLDENGDEVTIEDALANTYLDDGAGGIIMVEPDGTESYLGVAIEDENGDLIQIIPPVEEDEEDEGDSKEVTEINITNPPGKTQYNEGDKLDMDGIEIKADYSDGSSKTVDYGDEDLSYDPDDGADVTKDMTKVTVSYEGKTAEQPIVVNDNEGN